MMADQALYRPNAPRDRMGGIFLNTRDAKDRGLLSEEATEYATQFQNEERTQRFSIGCSNYTTNRAFVFAVEAARCLAAGSDDAALDLLRMASEEVQRENPRTRGVRQ